MALKLSPENQALLDSGFAAAFGGKPQRYFSAPGRTELGGNHTDHQRGKVLAAAVDLDTLAAVSPNDSREIRVLSQGYPMCTVCLDALSPVEAERGSSAALIRGVAAGFAQLGCQLGGFDAYCTSTVLPGSGLSSSAAFEVLMGTALNALFFGRQASPAQVAAIGQYAENVFFGKPCGLMDQMASAVGGLVTIDFCQKEQPAVRSVQFDFSHCGHALCIVDTGADHANLTHEYAAIPQEMGQVCGFFGKQVTTQLSQAEFLAKLPQVRKVFGDRAVLRVLHEFAENRRVDAQVAALEQGDFEAFLALVQESGESSWMYLQNVIPAGAVAHQEMAISLALCRHYLQGRGAYRVHGGGFAGTVQAFVPLDLLEDFRCGMDAALGQGACHVLSIRAEGGVEII